MTLAAILGWVATFLFTICYIPQIVKTLRTKTVEGVSLMLFVIQFIANMVALTYATLIQQAPLQFKYVLALVFLAICIGAYIQVLRHSRSKKGETRIDVSRSDDAMVL